MYEYGHLRLARQLPLRELAGGPLGLDEQAELAQVVLPRIGVHAARLNAASRLARAV